MNITKFKKTFSNKLYDHPIARVILDYSFSLIVTAISAFLFAYSFRAFTAPTNAPALISGGASGVGQIFVKLIYDICDFHALSTNTLQSIFFFLVNVPLFFLAFFKIGKRFSILTVANVLFVSLMIDFLPESMMNIFDISADPLARALFSGLLTGVSTSFAFLIGSSAGGVDVISMYYGTKKSTSLGKYAMLINAAIVIIYALLDLIKPSGSITDTWTMSLYTLVYFFTGSKVLDIMYTRNKKVEVQIITECEDIGERLITMFPHACTEVKAKGVYSGHEKQILYIIVTQKEIKKVIEATLEMDQHAFATVINTNQVYGKFYIDPIK